MKKLVFLIMTIFAVSFFVGCSDKTKAPNPALNLDTKSGKGALLVYRPADSTWRHKRFNIYINGEYKDPLMDKSHYVYDLKAGDYVVEIKEDVELNPEILKVEVEVAENKIRYLKLGAQSLGSRLSFKRVMKAIAVDDYAWNKYGY